MKLHLITIGTRMPAWVQQGFAEYAGRMPPECPLLLKELPAGRRGKGADTKRIVAEESQRLLAAVPKGARVVLLDVEGRLHDTLGVARRLSEWMMEGRDTALLVGGPEGVDAACRQRADERWSLSPLTFPHPLVRVILAEQLYRAWSLLHNHPYHRA